MPSIFEYQYINYKASIIGILIMLALNNIIMVVLNNIN